MSIQPQPLLLGKMSALPASPGEAILDCVPAPTCHEISYAVRLSVPEFTSLCPVTGAPDFAHIIVDYVPRELLIESKAFKLFMGSFRNHGAYHEACTTMMFSMLFAAMRPRWLRVSAYWFPRGGIPIDVFVQSGNPPKKVHLPPIDIPIYRAR